MKENRSTINRKQRINIPLSYHGKPFVADGVSVVRKRKYPNCEYTVVVFTAGRQASTEDLYWQGNGMSVAAEDLPIKGKRGNIWFISYFSLAIFSSI